MQRLRQGPSTAGESVFFPPSTLAHVLPLAGTLRDRSFKGDLIFRDKKISFAPEHEPSELERLRTLGVLADGIENLLQHYEDNAKAATNFMVDAMFRPPHTSKLKSRHTGVRIPVARVLDDAGIQWAAAESAIVATFLPVAYGESLIEVRRIRTAA